MFSTAPLSTICNFILTYEMIFKLFYWNWVPLKPSFSAKFTINLSIQNFIPFLAPYLFPSGLRGIQ